jgi:hypothetical protein
MRAITKKRTAKKRCLARNRRLCYDGGVQKVPYRGTSTWGAGLTETGVALFMGEHQIPVGIHLWWQMRKPPLAVLRGAR